MDLNSMKRKQLQELCKKHDIPANLTNLEMVDRLSSAFEIKESEKHAKRMRSCLKNTGEMLSEDRNLKKVRFSGENDVFEVSRSKGMGKVNHRVWGREDRGGSVRVTRGSKRASLGGHEVLISSPVVVKKRGRKVVKGRELELVVDLSNDGGEERNEVVTGKLLRNRRVGSFVEGHVGKVVTRGASESRGDGGSDCEGGVARGGVSRREWGLRRSTQNVKSFEESEALTGVSGDGEIVGKRNTRSRNQLAVDVSVVDHTNKSVPEVGDKVVDVSTRRSLRKRGAENTSAKSADENFENKGLEAKGGRNTHSGKALRQSRKNTEETEEVNEVPELTNVDLVGKRNTRSGKGSAVGCETKTETEFKNEDAQTVSRKILTKRSQLRRTNAKRRGNVVEEKASALDVGIPESEKALRRSKRNETELIKLESLQKELGKANRNGRRKTRSTSRYPAENSVVNTESGTTVALQEASEMPIKAEKPLQQNGQRVNTRHTDLGNKVGEEIGTAVQSDESANRQTRFSIRRKSIIPQIKKVSTEEHVTENFRRNKTGEQDFSNKSKELNKDSKTVGDVRKSTRNASRGDSLVIADVANGTDNSIVMIKTRKRGHKAIQEEMPLPHGRHVKTQNISLGDKAAGENEVAVQYDAPVQQRHTRSGSRQKSVLLMTKKRRVNESVCGNLGPNKVVGMTELSKKFIMEQKSSEIRGHVRRSGRIASGDDSPATSYGANDIDRAVEECNPIKRGQKENNEKNVVETEYDPVGEEPSGRIMFSASKSTLDRTAQRSRGRPRINPVSITKPSVSEAEASFLDYGPVGVEPSGHIVLSASKSTSAQRTRGRPRKNSVSTSKPPTSETETSFLGYGPVSEEPSGHIILSASKSTSARSAQRTSGRPRKNPVSTSKPPTSEVEASLPEYGMGSSCLDAQSLPENPQSTIYPVSCTRDTVQDKIECSIPQDSSNDVNSETPNFAEARDVVLTNEAERATCHEEQFITGTGELDEFHGSIRQEPDIFDQSAGSIKIGGLERDKVNVFKDVEEASFVDLHDATLSTSLMEEKNDARNPESLFEASSFKLDEQEKEVSVPKGIHVTDEPTVLDTVLSKPGTSSTEVSNILYCNTEVFKDSHRKRSESPSISCSNKQKSCTSNYVEISNSKEMRYSLADGNADLEPKEPSPSSANCVLDDAAADDKSCFKDKNSIKSGRDYEGGMSKDGDDGREIVKGVSIPVPSYREISGSTIPAGEVTIDGEDFDQNADTQGCVQISQIVRFGEGKSSENEFGASTISSKMLFLEAHMESEYKEKLPFDQQPILHCDLVKSDIADRGAERFVVMTSNGEDCMYDDGVEAVNLRVRDKAKIMIPGCYPGETSRQIITEKENNEAEILQCMASSSEQELQEVAGANESADQCSVQAISLQTPEKEIPSAGFTEENQLKPLFGTLDATSDDEKQISTGDVEHSVAEISLEKIQFEAIHGRLSPGNPFEIVEVKEMEDSEGSVLRSKGEKLTNKTFNSIEHTDRYTNANIPDISGKELESTGAAKCQNNKQISTPVSQRISEATFEAKLMSSKKTLTQSALARGLPDEGGSCHEISSKVMKNLPLYASLGDISPCTNKLVGGMDGSAFLAQVDIDCAKVKDAEPPKFDIAVTDDDSQVYERQDDASAVATEEILINEDAMLDRATLLNSCATLTSTEEINEEFGSTGDYLNDNFDCGAAEFFDSVMFSSELNTFTRADEVQEEKTDTFSQKNDYTLENCMNTREGQQSLTVSLTTEQLHKTEIGKLGEKDTGFLHNQIPGSVVPRCGDDKFSVDINVATLGKTLGESQCNENVHHTSSTKQDESLTNIIDKLFVGDECDVEASEPRDTSVSSESKL